MQLKSLGTISTVTKDFNDIVSSGVGTNQVFAKTLQGIDTQSKINIVTQSLLTEKQKLGVLATAGLSTEELKTVVSTAALSASQTTATATTTGFGTALKGLWATMLANPLILVATAVTAGITAWNIYKHSVDEMRKSTSEAASVFSDTSSSIEEYADKYKVLHDELTSANTTEERQHEIKSDLLSLQKELNDKYGEEYGKLNLVTDAYKDQTEAILAMNKASAQKYLNENREGIEDAKTQMTSKKTYMVAMDVGMYSESGSSILDLAKQMGLDVNADESTGTFTVRIKANPTEAYDSITDFMNQVTALQEDFGNDDYDIGSVLGLSSTSLNNAKNKIDEFSVKYNSALEAEITINDKLSRSFEEVKGAVQKYNDALASGDETKILSARDNLNKVKNSIDLTSTDWKDYASIVTDVFDQADTKIYDFEDSLKSNQDGLMNFAKTLRGISKEDILAISDAGDNENFEKLREAADELGLSAEDVIAVLERLKIVQGDVGKFGEVAFTPLSKQEVITNINSLSEGFESIDKIMKSISDKDNPFDYALLDDGKFTKMFSTLNDGGKAYTNFIENVSSSPKDIKATQGAFNDLVTTWIDSTGVLNGLTAENANLAADMLKNMGVANAEEVVMSRLSAAQEHLAAQKAYTAEVSNDLANATASEIPGIIDEATQSDIAKVALAGLVLEKEFFNGNALDTSGDIENIISLVGVIGTASKALQALNAVKSGKIGAGSKADYDFIVSAAEKEYEDAIKAASEYKGKGSSVNASYGGEPKTNKSSGSKKDKKDTEKEFDWIARKTKVVQDEYAKLEELANKDTIAYLGLTQGEFDKAKSIFDNGLGNTVKGLSQLQSYADKAGLSLGELYTMIQSGAPSASKENALQSMLQMQTETLLPQYQREVEAYSKAYEDALKAIPSEYKAKIENGGVDIESLPSDLAEKVQKAIDANEKLKKSEEQLEEGREKQIQTIQDLHENRIAATDIENEKLEQSNKIIKSQIELMEARGEIIDADFYKRQIRNNKGLISGSQKNIAEWESEMADLRAAKFDTNSKEYKELQAKVRAAKSEIYEMKLEQEAYNNKLLQMPIDHLSTLVSMYQDIGAAIQGWGDDVVASGGKLDADYYQSLISNGSTVINQLQKQSSLIKDVMDNYEVGSDNWNDLYKQLQSVNSEMSSAIQNIKKFNEELLKMPLENIGNFSSELQKVADGLSKVQSEQDQVITAVTGAIKEQIDLLNEQKDAVNEQKTAEIDALKEKLKLLNKENEYQNLLYDSEQKRYNLDRIKNQKTNQVVREGEIGYEEDAQARREAEQALLDSQYNLEKYNLQEQIDKAQESLDLYNDGLQEQIDALQKISDKWSEISEKITQAQNEAKAGEILGDGWKDKVIFGNDEALFNTFSGMYANTAEQLKKYQDQIDSTNNIQSLLEDYIASYKEGTITYTEAVNGINGLLSQLNQKMSATDNLQNIFDYLGTVNDTATNADAILTGIQSGLKDTATELLKSLEQYNKNSGMISEYTSSWQQLTNNVKDMLDVLKEVRDNQKDSYDRDDDDDDEPYDKSRGKGWGTGDVNNGPGVYADGIKNGLVGKSTDSEREKMLKHLATNNLKPGEVPILAHEGEAIFNDEQQINLLKNLASANSFKPKIPDYSSFLNQITVRETTPKQEFNFGDINIQKCDNENQLAQGILNGGLRSAIDQEKSKR